MDSTIHKRKKDYVKALIVVALAAVAIFAAPLAMQSYRQAQSDYINEFVPMTTQLGVQSASFSQETGPEYSPPSYIKFVSFHTNNQAGWYTQALGNQYCNTGHGYPLHEVHSYADNVVALRIAGPANENFWGCIFGYFLYHYHYVIVQDGVVVADKEIKYPYFTDQTIVEYTPKPITGSNTIVGIETMYARSDVPGIFDIIFGAGAPS